MTAPKGAGRRLTRDFFAADSVDLAPCLLNKLMVTSDGRMGRIIEVEAYRGEEDPASHAYRGPNGRNQAMFGPPGHLYVYMSYGIHWCANVVCGPVGLARAVLLRALAPLAGLDLMRSARWVAQRRQEDRDLCRGPGRLCQAMGIDRSFDGYDLARRGARLWVASDGVEPPPVPLVGTRVGISTGRDLPWRFLVDDPGVSRPVPASRIR